MNNVLWKMLTDEFSKRPSLESFLSPPIDA